MVDHKIQHQIHTVFSKCSGQFQEVFLGTVFWVHFQIIVHRIAAIAFALWAGSDWHQVHKIDSQGFEIGYFFL